MRLESLMQCMNQRSATFFDSIVKSTGGSLTSVCFKDMIRCSIGTIKSRFDQELIMFVYLEQGDIKFIQRQLFNMVYGEVPDVSELMKKVTALKSTKLLPPFFKGTRKLDDMLQNCAFLALYKATSNAVVSSRQGGHYIGCSKDTYLNQFQQIVDVISDNLSNRLSRAESRMVESIYGKSKNYC